VQIENFDFSGGQERNICYATIGAHEHLAQRGRRIESLREFAGLQVDRKNVALQASRNQPAAVGCGLGTVGHLRQVNPTGQSVARGINHCDSGRFLIVRKNVAAIGLNGYALNRFGNRNRGDERVVDKVENADRAGVYVGGVGAAAVRSDDKHVRFRLAGGIYGDDFARRGIDGVERLRKFGGHVQASVGTEGGLVRAQGFAQINRVREFALLNVDNIDRRAIGAGLAHSGVTVDGYVGITAVLADGDFVSIHADDDFCDFATGFRIDEQRSVLDLIRDDKKAVRRRRGP
jgi:hypothetical protein